MEKFSCSFEQYGPLVQIYSVGGGGVFTSIEGNTITTALILMSLKNSIQISFSMSYMHHIEV